MSFKSLNGVFEDTDDPDCAGDGVRRLGGPLESFTESFNKIENQEPCQDSPCPLSFLMESWRTWMFLTELGMVSGG